MSRAAHCIDNGPMEGFWGILKRERYYGRRFTGKQVLDRGGFCGALFQIAVPWLKINIVHKHINPWVETTAPPDYNSIGRSPNVLLNARGGQPYRWVKSL